MITSELFEQLFPSKGLNRKKYNLVAERQLLIEALNRYLPLYEIDTHKRIAAFLGCCGIETDYFRTTEEYASGAAYEGRKDLGNTQKGDGRRFKGRGLGQTTGRDNYTALTQSVGKALKMDFVAHPELLNIVPIAVESACFFWKAHNLSQYADELEWKTLNAIWNRGPRNKHKTPLHWDKRNALTLKCFKLIPTDITFKQPKNSPKPIKVTERMEEGLMQAADLARGPAGRTAAVKLSTRICPPLATAWATTTGKVFLTLAAVIAAAGIVYAAYLYRKQIQVGWETVKLFVRKKVGLS